jgi:hypothetical protein
MIESIQSYSEWINENEQYAGFGQKVIQGLEEKGLFPVQKQSERQAKNGTFILEFDTNSAEFFKEELKNYTFKNGTITNRVQDEFFKTVHTGTPYTIRNNTVKHWTGPKNHMYKMLRL